MIFLYISLGIVAGLIAASINCYKDAPYENFEWLKFFRSIFLGSLSGIVMFYLVDKKILIIENFGLLVLAIIPLERLMGEFYKGFVKNNRHIEFVHLFKNLKVPYEKRLLKLSIGFLALICYAFIMLFFYLIGNYIFNTGLPRLVKGMIMGAIGTSIVALGGGIKDSQFEGFDKIKFFRSPLMGILVGSIIINFTTEVLTFILAAIGLERIFVEFYKTHIQKKLRGVHKGIKPQFKHWFKLRWIFLVSLILCIALVVVLLFI